MTVTEEGCLECMGATGDCVREALSPTILDASAEQGPGAVVVGLAEPKGRRVPCEDSVTEFEDLLPATYPNTTHTRCRQDHALCCYQTPARRSRVNTYFEAFQFIRGRNCIYRLHFVIDRNSLEITGQLSRIVQFCDPNQIDTWGGCEGETQLDEVPDLPEDDTGLNVLEDSEETVYDDDGSEHETKLVFLMTGPITSNMCFGRVPFCALGTLTDLCRLQANSRRLSTAIEKSGWATAFSITSKNLAARHPSETLPI